MSTSIMPEPRQRYYTNSGTPAAGCKLWTYAAGTTTPKATYSDSAGTVPNTNPITLDAKGEALIFWTGSYKVDLKTAAGVQITGYPVDNVTSYDALITASDALLRADLAASTGSSIEGHIAAGAGAVATTAQSKLRTLHSPLDRGATGDGSTETTKWQAAIDYCSSIGGGVLLCDPGKTYVTGGLVPKSNVLIDLNGSTLKLANGALVPIFFDGGAGDGVNFGVINGTLDCNQSNNNGINVLGGVWLTRWNGLKFNNLTITNCYREGLNLVGVQHVEIKNYKFTNSGMVGAHFAYALDITASGAVRSQFVSIDGMECTNVIGFGIHFYQCDDFTAQNLKFSTLNYGAVSIAITFTEAQRGSVSNIVCLDVSGDNIEVNDSPDIEIVNVQTTNAGNRALLVGVNTAGFYNLRLCVRNFKSINTLGTVSAVLSACIDSSFEHMVLDKGADLDISLPLALRNVIKDSTFGVGYAASATSQKLLTSGKFTLERVAFSDVSFKYADSTSMRVSFNTDIAIAGVLDIPFNSYAPGKGVSGNISTQSVWLGGKNQGSHQSASFIVNNDGTAANLSAVVGVASQVNRELTFSGDAANRKLVLTNGSGAVLNTTVGLDLLITQ